MSKKKREERSVSEPAALKHNPFAALAQRVEAAAGAHACTTEGKPEVPPLGGEASPNRERESAPEERAPTPLSSPAARRQAEHGTEAVLAPQSKPERAKSAGRLVLRRETKGRGGKAVVIVTGFRALPSFDEGKTLELAQKLKQQLGCGGTVEEKRGEREIVLQGDRAAKVAELLRSMNFRVDGVTS